MQTGTQTQTETTTPATEPRALILTERAVTQVKEVMKAQGLDGHYLTVRVVPSGCSGFGYDLNLTKESRGGDLIWEQDGVQVCTDPQSAQYLGGTTVDYVTSLHGAGFKFENPKAKGACGCGNSFSV